MRYFIEKQKINWIRTQNTGIYSSWYSRVVGFFQLCSFLITLYSAWSSLLPRCGAMHLKMPSYLGKLHNNLHFFQWERGPQRGLPRLRREGRAAALWLCSFTFPVGWTNPRSRRGLSKLALWAYLGICGDCRSALFPYLASLSMLLEGSMKIKCYSNCYLAVYFFGKTNLKTQIFKDWEQRLRW